MAISTALPGRVPAKERPTIFNREMGVGILLGTLAGAAAIFALPSVLPLVGLSTALTTEAGILSSFGLGAYAATIGGGTLLGGLLGGAAGKSRMEQEVKLGVPVTEPSFFNRHIFSGLAIATLGVLAYLGITAATGAEFTPTWTAAKAFLSHGLLATTTGASVVGLASLGGLYGKGKEIGVYHQAEQIAVAKNMGLDKGLSPTPTIALTPSVGYAQTPKPSHPYTISADEQAQLNAKLEEGKKPGVHFAEQVTANRSVAAEPTLV